MASPSQISSVTIQNLSSLPHNTSPYVSPHFLPPRSTSLDALSVSSTSQTSQSDDEMPVSVNTSTEFLRPRNNIDQEEIYSELSSPSDSEDDEFENIPNDPQKWSRSRKNFILFIVAMAGILAPISSTILYPAIPKIKDDLHTSAVLANGLVSVFIFFKGAAPLVWASYSDTFGTRRKIYLVSFIIFIVASVMCGFAKNIWTLMVFRSLQSCGSSAVQSIGAGTISDIFAVHGTSYGIFYIGPLIGPLIGPIIGGFVTFFLGWRWIFWILTIFGGIILIIIFFTLPETFRKQPLPRRLLYNQTTNTNTQKRFNPFSSLALLKHPWVSLIQVYICAVFAIIFVQNTLVPRSFEKLYNLNTADVGLVFLAPSAGYMIGSFIGGKYSDIVLSKCKALNGGVSYPEMRLNSSWLGVIGVPISFLAYGWFIQWRLNIILPLITMFFGGFSTYLTFNSTSTYLVDAFPGRSASAIAVSNFLRGISAAFASLISIPLEDALGTGWTYTLLVVITVFSTSCLILVYLRGKVWRERFGNKDFYQR
ncbi:11224_t:CDS:2 [Diversispora eburnea]|uniref:11224_t:CDS:1 n=1 Tax=Diversispora eburnea TaxID=1213867 RepID=A0A9N8ZSB7_9GLOM|nr:11224_t:CDS:2 [Diversispora eburnea]